MSHDRPGGAAEQGPQRSEDPVPAGRDAGDPHREDELLGAYVLDALDEDEREEVGQAVARSPVLAGEAQRLQDALDELVAAGAEPVPAALWGRIAQATVGAATPVPEPTPHPARLVPGRTERPRRWLPAAAAFLAFLLAAVAAVSMVAGDGTGAEQRLRAEATTARIRGASAGTLVGRGGPLVEVVATRDGRLWLFADDLPRLRAGRTYQLWALDEGTPRSMAVLGATVQATRLRSPVVGSRLALTVEPAGGSPQPTGPPVAQGRLA